MGKSFTNKEFVDIFNKLDENSLKEILLTEYYKRYDFYILSSRIPMADEDWAFYSAYLTEERAQAQTDNVIKSYEYEESSCPPINISIDKINLEGREYNINIISSLHADFSNIIEQEMFAVLNTNGLRKLNLVFGFKFQTFEEADNYIKTLHIDARREKREQEELENDKDAISGFCMKSYGLNASDTIRIPGAVKKTACTISQKRREHNFVEEKLGQWEPGIFKIKPVKPFHYEEEDRCNDYCSFKRIKKYNADGLLFEDLEYSLDGNNKLDNIQKGFVYTYNKNKDITELMEYGWLDKINMPRRRSYFFYVYDENANILERKEEYYSRVGDCNLEENEKLKFGLMLEFVELLKLEIEYEVNNCSEGSD
jgi:hypothetical protein